MKKNWLKSLKALNRARRERKKHNELQSLLGDAVTAIRTAVAKTAPRIPVLIVCYNNAVYVKQMTESLQRYSTTPIILDNYSQDPATRNTLAELHSAGKAHVVAFPRNFGHMVGFLPPVYEILPELFAYSDPDLEFCPSMPMTFLEDLAELTSRYMVFKAGLAMSLDAHPRLSTATVRLSAAEPIKLDTTLSIRDGEAPFWHRRLVHESLEVHAAKIDTIFAVYRKSNYRADFFDGVRVAGDYKATHLPWFPALDPMSGDQKKRYLSGNISTTWLNTD